METSTEQIASNDTPSNLDAHSAPFVGRWQTLVSQTNWEKGKIISEWRQAHIEAQAPSTQYSDEAWASLVGFVTCQHVGRLRRVYDRFGGSWQSYPGLYWSHFWAALDWDDAELWLEGASQSDWSISEMRRTRAEAMQTTEATFQQESSRISEASQEDDERSFEADRSGSENFQSGPKHELPDFGEPQEKSGADKNRHQDDSPSNSMIGSSEYDPNPSGPSGSSQSHDPESKRPNPFESLGEFPQDVKDAVEQFKLCILRHRASQWQEITRDDLMAALDALRAFC
jgi:hypothetical protein